MQVLAWLVRPCGFDACPSCVSSSLVHAAPWLAGPREAEGVRAGEAGLDLSKEHLRTQELEQRGQLRIPSAFPSSGEGSGEEYAPLSRHHVGNRACGLPLDLKEDTPSQPPHLLRGLAGGVSGSLTAMRARFRAFQHGQQSQDMTGSACRFWRGLCVRAGSMLARRVSSSLVHAAPWLAGPREAEGVAAGEAGLDLSKEHLRTQELEQRGQLRIPSAFPSSGEGSGGGVRPPVSPSRRKPGLRCR